MEDLAICPVCKTTIQIASTEILSQGDSRLIDCPRCGKYKISRSLLVGLPKLIEDEEKALLLSYNIRKMRARDEEPFLNTYIIDSILKTKLPNLSDQCNNLILWLGDSSTYGISLDFSWETLETIMGATSFQGVQFVIAHLSNQGLIKSSSYGGSGGSLSLEFNGWQYYDEIRRGAITSRKAFMAMKFGINDLDWMFDNCFRPATTETGFDLYRIDKDPKAGLIDDQLRVEIRTSRFLIADLTHDNPGAYWEAGFAEGLGKPVIYLCEKQKFENNKTHFDTNHQKTITWEKEKPEEAANQLKATIRATLPEEAVLTDLE